MCVCVCVCVCVMTGAAAAALGLDVSSSIPPITMVFCAMDGVKDWKQINDKSKRQAVQRIIKDVLINTLVSVKGSYLCRLQEDEFKYMVAFPEPEVGVRVARHACALPCIYACILHMHASYHAHACVVPLTPLAHAKQHA